MADTGRPAADSTARGEAPRSAGAHASTDVAARVRSVRWFFPSFRVYRREWLIGDLIAGATLFAVALPEQIATARLAGMPPSAGIISFVAAAVVFAVIGTHRRLSAGADSTIAPVLAAAAAAVALPGPNGVLLLSVLVAILLIGIGAARLGRFARFLSRPGVLGLLAGIAVAIGLRQLPALLGLTQVPALAPATTPVIGEGTPLGIAAGVAVRLGDTDLRALGIGAAVLAIIIVSGRVNARVPGALIGVAGATALVAMTGMADAGLPVLGEFSSADASVDLSAWSWASAIELAGPAIVVALLILAQTAAAHSEDHDRRASLDRDLIAIGVASAVAGASGGFAVNASPPRTLLLARARARSQLPALVTAVLLVAVLIFGTGLVRDLPEAALAAVLLSVAGRLLRPREWRSLALYSRAELVLAVAVAVLTVVFGVSAGVIGAVVFAIVERLRREFHVDDVVLGRIPGTDHWVEAGRDVETEQVPGVLVIQILAPIWYADAQPLADRLHDTGQDAGRLVLDLDGRTGLDYTAALALLDLVRRLREQRVLLTIARPTPDLERRLRNAGVLEYLVSGTCQQTVAEAVRIVENGQL